MIAVLARRPLVYAVAIICALLYFVFPSVYTKPIAIWIWAGHLFIGSASRSHPGDDHSSKSRQRVSRSLSRRTIAWGLLLSSLGDIILEVFDDGGKQQKHLFIGGLAAFLLAHLMYIKALWAATIKINIALIVPMSVLFLGLMSIIIPSLDSELIIPVIFYGIVISVMGFLAANRCVGGSMRGKSGAADTRGISVADQLGCAGALVFMLSDSILSINQFVMPIPLGKELVMITYYAAQGLITAATSIGAAADQEVKDVKD